MACQSFIVACNVAKTMTTTTIIRKEKKKKKDK